MIALTLVLLAAAAAPAALSMLPDHRQPRLLVKNLAAVLQLVLLGAAALTGLAVAQAPSSMSVAATTVFVVAAAAAAGGSGLSTAVLDSATRERRSDPAEPLNDLLPDDDRPVLRGGAWIGVLERLATVVTLLAAWPEGLAVVLAVKGLARYSELRRPNGAAERFIIGTFCSVLWAAACAGIAMLILG